MRTIVMKTEGIVANVRANDGSIGAVVGAMHLDDGDTDQDVRRHR
jgi:hypothetical protein